MRRFALLLVWLVAASACTDFRYYAPRENRNGTGPGGYPAAVYTLATDDDARVGEVRLWSRGGRGDDAEADDGSVQPRVEVHVGFELENTGAVPLELAAIHSETEQLTLIRTEGAPRAAVGATARLDSWFLAPVATSTDDIGEFAIRFQVLSAGEPILEQSTPFHAWARRRVDYDPYFFGPPFGFGLGLGFGWHYHCR